MKNTPFIAVEGPIGIGKTSLSKAIADHFQFSLLKEIVEENPFLGKFYDNIEEWSFQTEMFFLCNRFKQLEDINKNYLQRGQAVVADYHIFKNRIFAERTLQLSQYDKYQQIYHILTEDMPQPNVIVYLNASLDTIMKRIALRGRDIEKNIDPQYLQRLINDYELFMEQFKAMHPEIPVLSYSGDNIDFVMNEEDLKVILNDVENTLKGAMTI
ncbi:deoxynucleoside kinase [Lottiidibacillus patelloidae]|uniref:Deoxynucleoside kinase n=1 Tax=Lottiidibacillus patelloidae TaxID=2670334 RepID=A0A263BQ76_9BACI|nr:deoxynucleoside kinase [Lottiidibacillus patelloidae]OZM55728.1 deoxynucleoside kinase [Lottiidibacillus patelloidae]